MADQKATHGGMKELSVQSLYGFTGNAFLRIFVFLASIVYTNLLGAQLFGVYSGLISFFSLLCTFVLFAFDRSLILYLTQHWASRDYGRFKGSMITSLFVMAGLFVAVALVFLLFRDFFLEHYLKGSITNKYLLYGFLYLIFSTLITFFDTVVNSLKSIALITISKVVIKLSTLGFFLVGYYTVLDGLDSLFLAQVFGLAIGVVFYLYRRRDTFSMLRKHKADYSGNPELMKYTLAMFFVGLSSAIVRDIDKIMLSTFISDPSEVAYYVVALRTGLIVSIFGASIGMIFRPRVAEAFGSGDMSGLEQDYQVTTRWILFLSFPALITFFIFPEQILSVFGAEFTDAGTVLRIVSLSVMVEVIFGLNTVIMILNGRRKLIILVSLTGVILNIFLNYLFIPQYGARGAALATLLTYMLGRTLTFIFVYKEFGVLPFRMKAVFQMIIIVGAVTALTYGLKSLGSGLNPILIVLISAVINYVITIVIYLRFAIGSEEASMLKTFLPDRLKRWVR